MQKGYLAFVLHAHLPYVRHPEYEDFLEEDWLYEAITETYIPLINVYDNLVKDGIDFRITMSVTPPLMSMLSDPLLIERYMKYLDNLTDLARKELIRTAWLPEFNTVAQMYLDKFNLAREIFVNRYGKNLVNAFRRLQDLGKLEIITCGATHGYLPLMEVYREAVRAQVKVAVQSYEKYMGRKPRGIWLAECGYNPGDDEILKENGIRYFFTDAHGILFGSPRPKYGVFAPVYCPSGVAAFGRDLESSKQVWSAEEGYPGDYNYREFYRDVGYDLEYNYIKPHLHKDGVRRNIGIKYYRITGRTADKQPYNPKVALEVAATHAGNFMFNREKQIEYLYDYLKKKPIIVAPYDAELYGHWWYEGPDWLNFVIRKISCDIDTIKLTTPSEYLAENPTLQVIQPSMSSWGYKGYSEVWLNGSNDWIYRHLHKCAERMTELANTYKDEKDSLKIRALNQAARELLLAQSSDWAFIMKTGTTVEYAHKRTIDHVSRFLKLYEDIKRGAIDLGFLQDIEWKDNIFPEIDYKVYCSQ